MRWGAIRKLLTVAGGALCLWLALVGAASAQRSHAVTFDQAQGLNAGEIAALAQDPTGFIWIGANGGLLRYDGSHFVWWGASRIRTLVREIEASKSGEIIAAEEPGDAFVVTRSGVAPLAGPDGRGVTRLKAAAFDRTGTLWAIIGRELWRRSESGAWKAVPERYFGNEIPVRLSRLDVGVGLLTDRSAWVLRSADTSGARLMARQGLFAITETSSRYWVADHVGSGLWRIDRGMIRFVGRPAGRLMSMTARAGTLWVSIDRYLLSIDSDGRKRIQGLHEGIPSGGPLLVDRDGSLWLGTFVGIMRFPEPDTFQWTEEDGLPSSHVHGLATAGGDLWAITWQGAARLPHGNIYAAPVREAKIDGDICSDNNGAWFASGGRLVHWIAGQSLQVSIETAPDVELAGCVSTHDGSAILAASDGLYLAEGSSIRKIVAGLDGRTGFGAIWRAQTDMLWLADMREACQLPLAGVRSGTSSGAACVTLPESSAMSTGFEVALGTQWLPLSSGLVEIRGGTLRRLPGNATLPGSAIQHLVPSASGGYWAVGPGVLLRISPCTDCADGWRLLEAPGIAQGLPGNSAVDVLETASRDLWVAGNRGLFHVPAIARRQPARPASIALVSASIDGQPVDTSAAVRVNADQHRLELSYSAFYFKDPSRLVYRYRLEKSAPWSASTPDPMLQLIDQKAGRYRAEMEASLDGRTWTVPAILAFSVSPPLWLSWPAIIFYALLFALLLLIAYRLRVQHLLSLQRQRLSIARDLHDELGSTLGSIVALGGALANPATEMTERSRIADQVVSTAKLAGAGLRSLVWTMRDQTVDAVTFGQEIAEQARRLAPQSPPMLQFILPTTSDDTRFEASLRREILMIVLESVHNAVRHVAAEEIKVALERHGSGWRLTISDDGRGFDTDTASLGTGISSMEWRATRIGGRLDIASRLGQGTTITLEFAVRKTSTTGPGSRLRKNDRV